jgi:hypothetical protein
MEITLPSDVARVLEAPREAFRQATDAARLAADKAAKMAPFQSGGMYAYVPPAEANKAARKIDEEHELRAGECRFELEAIVRQCEEFVAGREAEGRLAPDPVRAWRKARGEELGVTPPSDVIGLGILAEAQIARFERFYDQALPAAIEAAYVNALRTPLDTENANLIRWIESRHAEQWTGRDLKGAIEQAMAVQRLKKAIGEAREARIPKDVKAARALCLEVATLITAAERARPRGLKPLRPAKVG